jgi:hypothetical protein
MSAHGKVSGRCNAQESLLCVGNIIGRKLRVLKISTKAGRQPKSVLIQGTVCEYQIFIQNQTVQNLLFQNGAPQYFAK